MAQVSMTGLEYATLLEDQRRYHELVQLMCDARGVSIKKENVTSYGVGAWPDEDNWPVWLVNMMLTTMDSILINLSDEDFEAWIDSGMTFYNPYSREFRSSTWAGTHNYYNMATHYPEVAKRYQKYLESLEQRSETTEEE